MYKPGCKYCVTVPDSQSEERLKELAIYSIISGLIGIGFLIAALFISWQQHGLKVFSSQLLVLISLLCEIIAMFCLINSTKSELYLFEDTSGVEHLHSERPVRVGQTWHCNNPDGTSIEIKGYIVVITPNGWSNKKSYLLNPTNYSWKEVRAYSAYHSDTCELVDYDGRGPKVTTGEILTIINSCNNWSEYKAQTHRLGVAMCLARLQAQLARQTQPSPNAATMRRTLSAALSEFPDKKRVEEWEESANFELRRLYPGSSLTAEQMSPEPTQPPGIVA